MGATWTNVSTGLTGAVPAVTQLLIDRATGSTLYSLTSGGLFKSIDSGSSWTALGNIAGVNFIALDPTSASTIYAGTGHGVVTSTDGGVSWSSAGLSDTLVNNLAVDPITPSTLYAGGNGTSTRAGIKEEAGQTSTLALSRALASKDLPFISLLSSLTR